MSTDPEISSFNLANIPALPQLSKRNPRGAHRKYFFYDTQGNLLDGLDHHNATLKLSRMLYVRGYDFKKEVQGQTFHFTFHNGNSFDFIPQPGAPKSHIETIVLKPLYAASD